MEFASLIPHMGKDVAIAIINQFPAYVESSRNMIEQYNAMCDKVIQSNDDSRKDALMAYKTILDCKFWLNGAEFPIKVVQWFWNNGTLFTDVRCAFLWRSKSVRYHSFLILRRKSIGHVPFLHINGVVYMQKRSLYVLKRSVTPEGNPAL